jgi:hypothetical protein
MVKKISYILIGCLDQACSDPFCIRGLSFVILSLLCQFKAEIMLRQTLTRNSHLATNVHFHKSNFWSLKSMKLESRGVSVWRDVFWKGP